MRTRRWKRPLQTYLLVILQSFLGVRLGREINVGKLFLLFFESVIRQLDKSDLKRELFVITTIEGVC